MSNPEDKTTPATDFEAATKSYLEAFEARDVERCLSFFNEDAVIDFQSGLYRGHNAIADWHRDRFAADLKVIRLESISVTGDRVVVNAVVSSKRLAAWKINSVNGRITARFKDGRIQEAKLVPRMMSPIDLIRSGQ